MGEGLLQPLHLLVILAIVMLLFGPQKLPQIGKGLGEAIRRFREGLHAGGDKKIDDGADKKPESHDQ